MNLFNVYPLFDITPVRAKDVYVYDKNNVQYLDLYGGHAVISIGHSHPKYVYNIAKQINKILDTLFEPVFLLLLPLDELEDIIYIYFRFYYL